ncbi:hypothetical protein H0H81_004353 [Sphagnurus paluster]|uniref:Protein kinase domain-containing protein n=1 Tax=Sphagnurus paluster TaxID=117069 RepID=A0A9P7GMP2_9AGAR|nr:hypothetical protein H0H81_004353 [Sphagnurus paluster]
MGSGAYGVVISAADEISGETVAIKLVTRVFDKIQLAKRALREITLLRHFANHENITGLIDVDAISPDFNEIYIFMEPMEADLHQIIKSGQSLTNEHVQYFLYQILRGMKYVHSASVIHRDLKPGNLLPFLYPSLRIPTFFVGTPDEKVIKKIGSEKAQAYVRSLPFKKTVPFRKILPSADPQALDLLAKMLAFDPSDRISVPEALEHPWLAAYHDETDEPECPEKFEKWRKIEELETLEDFRTALWNEIEDYRKEVRGMQDVEVNILQGISVEPFPQTEEPQPLSSFEPHVIVENTDEPKEATEETAHGGGNSIRDQLSSSPETYFRRASVTSIPNDPVVTYARRSSIMQPSRQGSTYNSPLASSQHLPAFPDAPTPAEPRSLGPGSVAFPSQQGFVVPARSRTGSMAGGEVTRKLLRTLSTVSIHESVEGLAGGLAGIAPIGKFIVESQPGEADAPPSEMPREFGIEETSEGDEELQVDATKEGKEGKFQL